MRAHTKIPVFIAWAIVVATAAADPQYQIFDLGVVQVGDTASQGFGISPAGVAVGRSVRSGGAQAFTWTQGGGLVGLPNLAGRAFAVSNDANDNGVVVGTAASSLFGTSRLPVIWQSGAVSQLPLPAGETLGDANSVNVLGVAVGSVDGGSTQQAVIYNGSAATVITQTTANGSFFVTAFGINNSGRIVGQGIDPTNAARNVGIVYDMGSPAAFEVGALPGANGALAFAVSNAGHVVGSSMMNQGSGFPFIWSQANGIVAIPLATGTSQGSARGVNSAGWVVGQDSSAFSIPFLWDGTTTYRLADLLPPGSGWDLSMNTSASALGISDNNIIVGTGVHNGETHGYAMVPVAGTPTPTPTPTATPSPTPCGLIYRFRENFDGVTAPALPAGWVTGFTPGAANCTPTGTCALGTKWATSTSTPHTAPNCAFHDAPGCVTDSILDTPVFVGGGISSFLVIHHSYDLENGLDGAVVEISIDGGPFVDFVAAGGGNIGYNGTIAAGSQSPIAGRSAFTGNSGGYVSTFAHMPPGQNVRLRFRLATDCSGAGTGWRIDTISVETNTGCPSPTPSASPFATHFEVVAPSMVATFQPFNFTVRALDQNNNTATGYTGTVHFTSTSQGSLPANSTLTNGFGTFSATLNTLGNQTITATDTLNASITGTSNTILVISDIVTPPPTPTPTTTPPPPTPTTTPGQCTYVFLDEKFDGVTAPALPPGWSSSFTPGPANCTPTGTCALGTQWTTSTTNPSSPPNCAFHDAPGCVTDSSLYSPTFHNGPTSTILVLENNFDLEAGRDGAVLEISINGGPFIDFVTAGGLFNAGGYTGTISTAFQSPIGGRQAWTGTSTGSFTVARMPDTAAEQNVVLRFRLVTDCSGAGTGQRIDDIKVTYFVPCQTPTPTPTPTPSPTATATGTPPPTPTPSPTPPTQALNLSTRLRVQTGDNAGIGGFIITGNAPKYLLFRGIGPSLTGLGIAGALANPTLDLRRPDGTRILANDNWRDTQETEIQATGIPPSDNLEAAIVQTLDPGSYTIILRGMGMTTGIGLVEIYDLDHAPSSKLANISTRAFVETGANIMIAGFIVGGTGGSDRMALRGIGPSLASAGVSNTLADPTLELRDGNGTLLRANNDWQDDPAQAAELTAAGLALSDQLESGIAMTLSPGAYTALLAGLNNGTGIGLVEVYDLGAP